MEWNGIKSMEYLTVPYAIIFPSNYKENAGSAVAVVAAEVLANAAA